ncbi:MAG: hypothetical protein NC432_08110 [Roseburia sp.]|nr:hypothetical protein [Roseburia sp.]MCM1099095.1 hypothetical protein [Ruminococcus flavefaciens]MCM1222094.1 hypothetical protein [Lachnospiraceae bacterium]
MTEQELKRDYEMFTKAWKFFKKYSDVQDTDSYWQNVVAESDAIAKEYGNCRLCRDLLLAALSKLERKKGESQANN